MPVVEQMVVPQGAFALAASARFLEGFTPAARAALPIEARNDGTLRLGFPVEGSWEPAGVAIRQKVDDGPVEVTAYAEHRPSAEAAVSQSLHALSADVDGTGLDDAVAGDPVAAGLARRSPGFRPVGFYSPYEAAVWAVLSQRIQMVQAAAIKATITTEFGDRIEVGDAEVGCFPAPQTLLDAAESGELARVGRLPDVKVSRLEGVAREALEGRLASSRLLGMPTGDALAGLQEIRGIGPFGAELILIRGAMAVDVFPLTEQRLLDSMREAYDRPDADVAQLSVIGAGWAPYRSWVSVLFRADRESQRRMAAPGRRSSRR